MFEAKSVYCQYLGCFQHEVEEFAHKRKWIFLCIYHNILLPKENVSCRDGGSQICKSQRKSSCAYKISLTLGDQVFFSCLLCWSLFAMLCRAGCYLPCCVGTVYWIMQPYYCRLHRWYLKKKKKKRDDNRC